VPEGEALKKCRVDFKEAITANADLSKACADSKPVEGDCGMICECCASPCKKYVEAIVAMIPDDCGDMKPSVLSYM
jgi:hypothetical protein